MRRAIQIGLLLLLLAGCGQAPKAPSSTNRALALPRRPFPQHTLYTAGTIKPNHLGQDELDAATAAFYEQWKGQYLRSGCGDGRYYVQPTGGGGMDPNTISISEGHGYGMIIAVLMAGYDPQAQAYLDGLYYFFKDHPSTFSPYLMAWNQVAGCSNGPGGDDSATDGDLDIAYALLLADRQWGSAGAIDYRGEALQVIQAIKEHEVNPEYGQLMLGDWVTTTETLYFYATRPSDFMLDHLRAYGAASGDPRWSEVLSTTIELVQLVQGQYSTATGLLPDFIQDINTSPRPADPGFLEGPTDGQYAYNACRTPWRLGTDYLLYGEPATRAALGPINAWVRANTGEDPQRIVDGYDLAGNPVSDYNALAFVAPLGVGAMVAGRPVGDGEYYGDTLKLLCMLVMSGNWWSPDEVGAPSFAYLPVVRR
jgi:endo-1,4-beta-D-glucanase Y